ncbi:MAG: dUTP diphosphatase [Pelagibacterales bacterium]|nr:dUTP diphosphatase [Pelagibacterales bacterium]OUV27117.1 MAG: deoxyuridine 5'-triphosphate nucleotidohydrolase [Alphaproteobacteria bacterium TMED109]RCL84059.1 MAG: dUTP diphosphatase [Alphaproteobacteria bacterium]|tara:strand:+ start:1254 stop:1700 length:447 start_codon:yes stop_codon:yes gene_type:complete
MDVKITLLKHGPKVLPEYATKGSAGLDVMAAIHEPISIGPGERILVPSGFKLEIPVEYEVQIRPRSGLAIKHGITVLNSPGTIDSDYRGEIGIILINHSKNKFIVNPKDRIAQMVICKVTKMNLVKVSLLNNTERGSGGFGSTGNNNE